MKNYKAFFPALVLLSITLFYNCKNDDDNSDPIEICDNGIDDDGDGFVDGDDFDCQERGTQCSNGIDDDGDGFIDNEDFDCTETGEECNNGIDDDGDGFTDCDDLDCEC